MNHLFCAQWGVCVCVEVEAEKKFTITNEVLNEEETTTVIRYQSQGLNIALVENAEGNTYILPLLNFDDTCMNARFFENDEGAYQDQV